MSRDNETLDFSINRAQLVHDCVNSGRSLIDIAEENGVSVEDLQRWVAEAVQTNAGVKLFQDRRTLVQFEPKGVHLLQRKNFGNFSFEVRQRQTLVDDDCVVECFRPQGVEIDRDAISRILKLFDDCRGAPGRVDIFRAYARL